MFLLFLVCWFHRYASAVLPVRGTLFAMAIALAPYDSVYLPLGIIIVLMFSIFLTIYLQPYRYSKDNLLETFLLLEVLVTFFAATLANLDAFNNSKVALFANLLHALAFAVVVAVMVWGNYDPRQRDNIAHLSERSGTSWHRFVSPGHTNADMSFVQYGK